MEAESIYERNDAIDANLGPNLGLTSAPPIWAEKCTGLADKIRRVLVNWKKGRGAYELIPEAVIDVPILEKKDAGETNTDLRFTDLQKWGQEIAARAWALALDHAEKNGPIIDAQIILCGWDEPSGLFRPLKGGVSAKKCPDANFTARDAAEYREDHRDRTIDKLLEAIDRRDLRVERMSDKFVGMAGGIEKIMGIAFSVSQHAIEISNNVSAGAAAEKQAERDFVTKIVQMQTTADTVKAAVTELAPTLKDLVDGFGGSGPVGYLSTARELLKSISQEQRDKAKEAGESELVADLETILKKIVAGADDDECKALLWSIGPRLNSAQATIGPILNEKQRDLVLSLLKRAGLIS